MPKLPSNTSKLKLKVDTTPITLKPYIFHGLDLDPDSLKESRTTCPFCLGENKFTVNVKTGTSRCFICAEGSEKGGLNHYTFIRKLLKDFQKTTSSKDYSSFTKLRSILFPESLIEWGLAKSSLNNNWVLPGFNSEKKINQLYRLIKDKTTNKHKLLPTPGMSGHGLFGLDLYNEEKSTIYLFEGPWDAICFYELINRCKPNKTNDGLVPCAHNDPDCIGSDINVLAVPGVNTFLESWIPLFEDKIVYIMFDNDHILTDQKTGKQKVSAGFAGTKRVASILYEKALEVNWINWGPEGYTKDYPHGFDVRDYLSQKSTLKERCNLLDQLLSETDLVPIEWIDKNLRGGKNKENTGDVLSTVPCSSYETLIHQWDKAMKWTDGLDTALSVMLASITSTRSVGDQLWIKIIGPASCGKSTLCEAISVNTRHVIAKSTIRGFHSGFGDGGGEDASLISKLFNRTLVTKDGDTLLQSPNLNQILSEARDIYDSVSRTHYRNRNSRNYNGIRMTWLLCGTSSLRSIDSSELGERFLDCVIMDGIDDYFEDQVLWRVAKRTNKNLSIEADGNAETQYDPHLIYAMQLTGGYIDYLRDNAQVLLEQTEAPDQALRTCTRLGKFISFMRARPSTKQSESVEREFAARLVSQLVRLAKCLAVVMNKGTIDKEVMKRTSKVAFDTARGITLTIVKTLYEYQEEGLESRQIAIFVGKKESFLRDLLDFMRQIKILEIKRVKGKRANAIVRTKWFLTENFYELYEEILSIEKLYSSSNESKSETFKLKTSKPKTAIKKK